MIATRAFRRGFTLVELLVVITIIGILVSMLLPAVNQVREAGRQTQCKSNLRQLALAMDMYHSKRGTLPHGTWYTGSGSGPDWKMINYSWGAMHLILPFIEQQAIYNAFNFRVYQGNGWTSTAPKIPGRQPSESVRNFLVPVFVCPSDSARGVVPGSKVALCNYAGSAGSRTITAEGNWNCKCSHSYNAYRPTSPTAKVAGPFRIHNYTNNKPAVNYAQIRDGVANTILIGELRYGCSAYIGSGWVSPTGGSGHTTTIIPINVDTCQPSQLCQSDACKSVSNGNLAVGFKSAHPGGANFAMCDGSVHFFSESIDHQLYQYLGACDDGRPARVP